MSRVSWQKEADRSESINFQIGSWSMTAGEAAATSSSREGSNFTQAILTQDFRGPRECKEHSGDAVT